jgi:hypothetical protein
MTPLFSFPNVCFTPTSPGLTTAQEEKISEIINVFVNIFRLLIFLDLKAYFIVGF